MNSATRHPSPSAIIRTGRLRLAMTEQQFADACHVSRGAVQQWERAGGTAPKRANQARVAKVLGITVAELLGHAATHPEATEVPVIPEAAAEQGTPLEEVLPIEDGERVPTNVDVRAKTFGF